MKKILVIDDNKDILYALSEILNYKKWESFTAETVQDGLVIFQKWDIDLIIIDYHMPGINGLDGVKMFRGFSSSVPIIVLTVEESQETAERFLNAGASDFALKPIKAPDLLSRLMVHLRSEADRSAEKNENFRKYTKGINLSTLTIIERTMKNHISMMTLERIAEDSGLAYQTVHRYLKHFMEHRVVDSEYSYGKVGRPKQFFRWKK
ncbi:MAG: response regulator [Spirochaetales bacterium]|nr:response regulator [Spirochaetales bacterium]